MRYFFYYLPKCYLVKKYRNKVEYRTKRNEEIEKDLQKVLLERDFKKMELDYLRNLFGTIQHNQE